jgi:hypothetical protein
MEESRSIFDRLPAFYRENPDLLGVLVDVLDDVLSGVAFRLGNQEDRILSRLLRARMERLAGGPKGPLDVDGARHGKGTLEGLRRFFRARHGCEPWIWTGFRAVEGSSGWLELRRSRTPSILVSWERASPGAVSGEPPPQGFFPVGVEAQGLVLLRPPARTSPLAGERIRGTIEWALTGHVSSKRMGPKEVKSP